ncbi:MAG: hypothetical protein IT539_13785 [Bradyrhizobiaceae bacterium]|nr:hypothetical protein [Bradyrhizobiaceae bacterium]
MLAIEETKDSGIHVKAPAEMCEAVKRAAKLEYTNVSSFVRRAIADALLKRGEKLGAS